jgi:hypothetical protein
MITFSFQFSLEFETLRFYRCEPERDELLELLDREELLPELLEYEDPELLELLLGLE